MSAPMREIAERLEPCPFCGGANLKTGGDDKIVGVWCLTCEATGPNEYGKHAWNRRASALRGAVEVKGRRRFPILDSGGQTIDWELVADHGKQVRANHYQSVEELASRGGLAWTELHAVLHDRKFERMDESDALIACRALEAKYLDALKLSHTPAVVTEGMVEALIAAAPHHQGANSISGRKIASVLGIDFPIRCTIFDGDKGWLFHAAGEQKSASDLKAALSVQPQPVAHDLYKTGDTDAPNVIKDRNGEVVLGMCRRCRKAEIELDGACVAPQPVDAEVPSGMTDGEIAELVDPSISTKLTSGEMAFGRKQADAPPQRKISTADFRRARSALSDGEG